MSLDDNVHAYSEVEFSCGVYAIECRLFCVIHSDTFDDIYLNMIVTFGSLHCPRNVSNNVIMTTLYRYGGFMKGPSGVY